MRFNMNPQTQPTLDEMWIEILKWMGWLNIRVIVPPYGNSRWVGNRPGRSKSEFDLPPITLDELYECENKLTDTQQDIYTSRLLDGKAPEDTKHACWLIAHASKEERRTALWKTISVNKNKTKL